MNELARFGIPVTNAQLAQFAEVLAGKPPGKKWASRWLKRHADKLIPVADELMRPAPKLEVIEEALEEEED